MQAFIHFSDLSFKAASKLNFLTNAFNVRLTVLHIQRHIHFIPINFLS